jgi:hypothetical protein
MNPDLANVLRRKISQAGPDFIISHHVIPDPQRTGAELGRWFSEKSANLILGFCRGYTHMRAE